MPSPCYISQDIGYIIPSKVPYNDDLPPDKRYTFKQWITNGRKKLGLVIDLTNTNRYYNPSAELRREGVKHVKFNCSGCDAVPDNVSVNTFVHEVNEFEKHNLLKKYLLVHCTHGHNRTGFMIVHYLLRTKPMMSVIEVMSGTKWVTLGSFWSGVVGIGRRKYGLLCGLGMGTFRGVIKAIDDNIMKIFLKEIKEMICLPMYFERIRSSGHSSCGRSQAWKPRSLIVITKFGTSFR